MESVVKTYIAKGYAVTTLRLEFDVNTGKKIPRFKPRWQQATRDNCLQEFVNFTDNAIAVITGEASDLLVIDADHLKPKEVGVIMDGLICLNQKIQSEGLPAITPIAKTGSGGKHVFFSMAKSLQAGLMFTRNRSKVYVDDKPTSIDVRADGGGILCAPTKYKAGDEMREYSFEVPLCAVDELEAAPAWLIDLLNRDTLRKGSAISSAVASRPSSSRQLANNAGNSFYAAVKSIVEMQMGNQIARQWDRQNGFDFSVEDKEHPCVVCKGIHTSNVYACRQILTSCFTLSNYSTSCRSMVFHYADHPVIHKILECPTTDDPFVALLQTKYEFASQQLKASGDENNPSFYLYDGKRWKQEADISIQQDLRLSAYHIIDQLAKHLKSEMIMTKLEGEPTTLVEKHLKSLQTAKVHIQRAGNIKSITASAKQLLWDQDFAGKLDMNPDLLCARNGVIDLVSGDLRIGRPEDCVSKAIKTDFMGLDFPCPDIEAFFFSIFEDHEVVTYMQRLLGYAITGHTKEQKIAVFSGVGANGKGVLLQILEALLGYALVTMSPDCIIKKGRAPGKGAPTPYMAALQGARLAICDEAPDDAVLDEESVKRATGQTTIEARFLGANPIYFKPTHLPVLLTNEKPKININDGAVLRRLLVVPFDLIFKSPEEFQPDNPLHRPMDKSLADKLLTKSCQEQLLVWLVRGAQSWYTAGLPSTPQKVQAAFAAYVAENDVVQKVIDDYCETGDGFEVETKRFAKLVTDKAQQTMRQSKLNAVMLQKGFHTRQSSSFATRTMAFQGIRVAVIPD